jgi:glycosyltransferase involved in cell wall biosynthesis
VVVPTRDRPASLSACLAALERSHASSFEVVVVDDGSIEAERVAAVVAAAPRARLVRGDGRGPAAARNRGARAARAPILCFTDDDCRPASNWVDVLSTRFAAAADDVVAGPTRNGKPRNACAAAAQTITNHLVESSFDATGRYVGFAPTSNLACRAELHRTLPFDEEYPLAAAEDRDWCRRLAERRVAIAYEPAAWVEHHPELSLRAFWRQQVRYGRGARRLRAGHAAGRRLQPITFYLELFRKGFAGGALVGALVVLAQFATAVGVARESWAER